MTKRKRALKVCAYCGEQRATEEDHIPPDAIFAVPRPSNRITVPACSTCNRGFSKDDEYFRMVLSMRHDVADHVDVKGGVLDSALRSLAKPEARGMARAFLKTIREVDVRSPGGLYLGTRGRYTADGVRVLGTAERIARGLFFHEQQRPLGPDCLVRAFEQSLVNWTAFDDEAKRIIEETVGALATMRHVAIGQAFRYACSFANHEARLSAWRFVFFDRVVFLVLTAPPRET